MDLPPSVTKTPGIVHVAASKDDFQASLGCGVCLKIVGSGKPAAADLAGSPPVEGDLKGIIVDQDDSLNQGIYCVYFRRSMILDSLHKKPSNCCIILRSIKNTLRKAHCTPMCLFFFLHHISFLNLF